MNQLPDKPSDLLELALHDLALCEQDKRYEIDMMSWHSPDGESPVCLICLAGAVMAQSLQVPVDKYMLPMDLDPSTSTKLSAIDSLREGELELVFMNLNLEQPVGMPNYVRTCDYSDNPQEFKRGMRDLIQQLKEFGQ